MCEFKLTLLTVTPSYFMTFPESSLRYYNAGVMSFITVVTVPRTNKVINKYLWEKGRRGNREREVEEKKRKRGDRRKRGRRERGRKM